MQTVSFRVRRGGGHLVAGNFAPHNAHRFCAVPMPGPFTTLSVDHASQSALGYALLVADIAKFVVPSVQSERIQFQNRRI